MFVTIMFEAHGDQKRAVALWNFCLGGDETIFQCWDQNLGTLQKQIRVLVFLTAVTYPWRPGILI